MSTSKHSNLKNNTNNDDEKEEAVDKHRRDKADLEKVIIKKIFTWCSCFVKLHTI